jgi:hypothetical protein
VKNIRVQQLCDFDCCLWLLHIDCCTEAPSGCFTIRQWLQPPAQQDECDSPVTQRKCNNEQCPLLLPGFRLLHNTPIQSWRYSHDKKAYALGCSTQLSYLLRLLLLVLLWCCRLQCFCTSCNSSPRLQHTFTNVALTCFCCCGCCCGAAGCSAAGAFSCSSCSSSPDCTISLTMSQPPMSSPATYSCGYVGQLLYSFRACLQSREDQQCWQQQSW